MNPYFAWPLALLATALMTVAALAIGRALERGSKPLPGPQDPPPDRSALAKRVAELEAQLPSVVRQVRELDDSTNAQFRKVWGSISVARRADRQAGVIGSHEISVTPDDRCAPRFGRNRSSASLELKVIASQCTSK